MSSTTTTNPAAFQFTTAEQDLIILGVSQITRRNPDGSTSNIQIPNQQWVNQSYAAYLIYTRVQSGGITDLHILYTNNAAALQLTNPALYTTYSTGQMPSGANIVVNTTYPI